MSSRHVIFGNKYPEEDPNLYLMLMPLFDMINHNLEPNAIVLPYNDKVSN